MSTFDKSRGEGEIGSISSFSSTKWLVTMLTVSLEVKAKEMATIIHILECNTFDALMKNLGQPASVEISTVEALALELSAYYRARLI